MRLPKFAIITILLISSIQEIGSVSYELYTFESFWLGTVCKFSPCLSNETQFASKSFFNIHGLWPDYLQGYPEYCDNASIYQPEDIETSIQQIMKTYWIGMNESSDMFHAHEWSKHGTCWNDPIPTVNQTRKMNDYFAAAIAVAFKINMYEVLAESDIVPSNTAYTLKQFVLALNTTWGPGTFGIDCQDDTSGNQYLNDISLCLSLDYNIIECPDYVSSSCEEGDIYYLPINFENDKTVHSSEMDEDFLTTSKYQSNIFYDYIPSKFMT